jgi:scyllo-inositol 2-dehydrogenase (NADP+)
MNKKDSVNIGLIGFGMAGQIFHAPFIEAVEGLNLTVVQTSNEANIKFARRNYPDTKIVGETSALLADDEIDLVFVGTPTHTHFELAKKVLEAGKHAVVEKPFTVSSSEGFKLARLAESRGLILSIHQNRRWDSDFLTVRKIVEKKMLGRLVEAEIHYDRYRPAFRGNTWKEENLPGTGVLYDLGSHLIDQAQTLFGLPDAVTADIRTQRTGGEIPDNFEVILHYADLKVTLKSGMLVREPLPHYILLGEKGAFIKYGMDVQEADLNAGKVPLTAKDWGVEPEDLWGKINTEFEGVHLIGKVESEPGNYRKFFENIRDAVLQNAPLIVTAGQAANTIKIVETAIQSSKEKRTIEFSE